MNPYTNTHRHRHRHTVQSTEHATHELWNKCHKNHLTEPLEWQKHTHSIHERNTAKQNTEQNADEWIHALALERWLVKKKENSFENGLPQFLLQTFRGHFAANQPNNNNQLNCALVEVLQNKPSSLRAHWNWFSSQPRKRKNKFKSHPNFSLVPHYVVTSAILMQNAIYYNAPTTIVHTLNVILKGKKNHMYLVVVVLWWWPKILQRACILLWFVSYIFVYLLFQHNFHVVVRHIISKCYRDSIWKREECDL